MRQSWSPRWREQLCRPVAEDSITLRLDRALRTMLIHAQLSAVKGLSRVWKRGGETIATCAITVVNSVSGTPDLQLCTQLGPMVFIEKVAIAWSAQRLGGQRAWFICPGCHGRCGVLFNLQRTEWRCRRCFKVTYQSSNHTDRRVTQILNSPNLATHSKR